MDQKLEHLFASASTEDASDLDTSEAVNCDSGASHSSVDSSFMKNYEMNHFYIPRSSTINTNMIWFEQMEADILRVVHRTRIEPNYWTSLSAEEREQFM